MGVIIKIPVEDMQIGTDKGADNLERFFDTAYSFFVNAYNEIENASKEEFIREVEEAPAKFGILELSKKCYPSNQHILAKRVHDWTDLKSALGECMLLLDDDYYDDYEYKEGNNIHRLIIRTRKFNVLFQKDLQPYTQRRIDAMRLCSK